MLETGALPLDTGLYLRPPLSHADGMPVYMQSDAYVENYNRISRDHLQAERDEGSNPFMDDRLWREIEDGTIELISRYAKPGASVLDVGVGLGRLMSHFPQLLRYGTDISLPYLAEARKKDIEVCASFAEDLPYVDGRFDLVVSTDVLEHVLDLNRAAASILRVLKPGGHGIFRVPYRESLEAYASPSAKYEFVHLRSFDEHGMRLFFERIMRVRMVETTFGCPIASRDAFLGPSRTLGRVITRLMVMLEAVSWRGARVLTRAMFAPGVINVVVHKPLPTAAS